MSPDTRPDPLADLLPIIDAAEAAVAAGALPVDVLNITQPVRYAIAHAGVTLTQPQPDAGSLDVERLAFAIAAAEGGDGWTPWGSERTNANLIAEKYAGLNVHTHHPECAWCNPSLLTQPQPDAAPGWEVHSLPCDLPNGHSGVQQTTTTEDDAWLTGKTQTRQQPAWSQPQPDHRTAIYNANRGEATQPPMSAAILDGAISTPAAPHSTMCPKCGAWMDDHAGVCPDWQLPPDPIGLRSTPAAPEFGGSLASVQPTPAAPQPECSLLLADGTICVKRAGHSDDHGMALRSTPAAPHQHRFDVVIRDDEHMRLLGCSNTPCEEAYQWDR